jgi:hypothetical protein
MSEADHDSISPLCEESLFIPSTCGECRSRHLPTLRWVDILGLPFLGANSVTCLTNRLVFSPTILSLSPNTYVLFDQCQDLQKLQGITVVLSVVSEVFRNQTSTYKSHPREWNLHHIIKTSHLKENPLSSNTQWIIFDFLSSSLTLPGSQSAIIVQRVHVIPSS